MFSIFGGVPEITQVREGRLRCQGPFAHAILAGCFWAAITPLMVSRWWKSKKDKVLAIVGFIASCAIVVFCASSTPVLGMLAAILGASFFFVRRYMRYVRWTALATIVGLHIVMKAPVWHLIGRISAVGGSTGYHRYLLIDQAIRNFRAWWFSGCTSYTVATWGIWAGDITNQYVLMGVRGGIVSLILFVTVIAIAYRDVGRAWRVNNGNRYRLALSWALGTSLFVHCTMFIGVSYFGQIDVIWYLLLAIIGSLSVLTQRSKAASIAYSQKTGAT